MFLHDDKKLFGESGQDSKKHSKKWRILWQTDNWRRMMYKTLVESCWVLLMYKGD